MPVALALICGTHLFTVSEARVRSEEEKTQVRRPPLLHFEIQFMCATFSRGGGLASLSHSRLWKRKQSALLTRARLLVSAYQRRMSRNARCMKQRPPSDLCLFFLTSLSLSLSSVKT